jgi:hypothetical protein
MARILIPPQPDRARLSEPAMSRQNDVMFVRSPSPEPDWYTVAQLCRRWQVNRKTVYKFIDAEVRQVCRLGPRLFRVAAADVLRFESKHKFRSP